MPSNQAAWLDGKDQKLRVADIAYTSPGADDVVIQNHSLAINPVDWKIQDSGMFIQSWPTVVGCDVAGEVYEVGSNVTAFKKGDRVIAHSISLATGEIKGSAFQLYSTIPAATVAILPSSISYNQGSVLPLAIDTAAVGLYAEAEKGFFGLPYPSLNPSSSGKTLLVWGGSSSVGALTIQLAVASGVKVVSVASKHNIDFVKSLGASEVLDYNTSSVVEDVVKAVKSVGGDYLGIYDAISTNDSFQHVLPITEKLGGGKLVLTLGGPKEGVPENVKIANVFGVNAVTHPVWKDYITPALEHGKLKAVPEAQVVGKGLENVQKGLDTLKAGVSAKKVVVEL
ncbi:zinc-binding oxidoreductase CipB like protein [Zymoseptoria brevis]|uniref:Zinc-binding oxidoreductase CipB like protein n=1 Tax=Zymoseptoria brevis TaxID=1047168 RepID=A0A0F4GFA6_9PEZI|nr:zinc-binding oxidoreductase CipB like protein [Zymoseptoria brevis]